MTFLFEACLRAYMRGSRPDSGCTRLFQTAKWATRDPVFTDATAMNNAPNGQVLEDISVQSPYRHGRAHDPSSSSYSDGSARKVDGSPKGNGPEPSIVGETLQARPRSCSAM